MRNIFLSAHVTWRTLTTGLVMLAAGCSTLPPASSAAAPEAQASASSAPAPTAAAAPAKPAPAPASAPAAGQPPAFATVIKDAKRVDGLFTLWQKDDKVWIELAPADFGKPLFLGPKISRGIGEAGLFGGTMIGRWPPWGRTQLVEFRRMQNQIQLIAPNTEYTAAAGTPQAAAVRAAYSPSLIGATPVASLPEPERKSVLIEANALFLTDMLGMANALQRVYRQGYTIDARNSTFTEIRGRDDAVFFDVNMHFATGGIAVPQGGPPGTPAPSIPGTLPDARSLFLGLHYSLSSLPEQPMATRAADPHIGHFTTVVQDFTNDLERSPRMRFVNRWRLEKKDPQAPMSEPVTPIVFWIDRTVPLRYRDAVRKGILEWNKAFEPLGFSNTIQVKDQPDDADFDTLDIGVPSVRWMTNASLSFVAYGPTQVDPRSGEILDADIVIESLALRATRNQRTQVLALRESTDWAALMQLPPTLSFPGAPAGSMLPMHDAADCRYAELAAEQLDYALDVLEARGDIEPDSPEAERFVLDHLTETTMHEVGHALGLRHNFRSSRAYSESQLGDATFTRERGISGSVMDYTPINLPSPGEPGGVPYQLTLGPYDYWAIEYAYRTWPAEMAPADQLAELQKIAARSAEPQLAYGTDEDNAFGIDPETLVFDLGNDEVAFASKRIAIAHDLIRRRETRPLDEKQDYGVLRRAVGFAVRDAARAAGILARQIGAVRTLRDFPGSGRDPLAPVETLTQRHALDVLGKEILAPDALAISPALARRMAPDYFERAEAAALGLPVATDFSLGPVIVDLQRALLAQLMSDAVATRILDSEDKAEPRAEVFRLKELYDRLLHDIWSDLEGRADIATPRRELQREYINRVSAQLLRPEQLSRADARSLVRAQAQVLLRRLKAALHRPGLGAAAQAHLADSADTLEQALTARIPRAGV